MRVKQVDVLRGIAALLVVFFHLTKNTDMSKTTVSVGSYGFLGVEVFFVISGFILPFSMHKTGYKTTNYGTFLLKRIIRIYPAYLVALFVGIIAAILKHTLIAPTPLLYHFVFLNALLGMPSISPVFWTLAMELQFYLIIGLLFPLLKSNVKSVSLIIAMCIGSVFFNTLNIIFWLPFFCFGILVFNYFFTQMPAKIFWLCIALLTAFVAFKYTKPHAAASLFAVLFIVFIKIEKGNLFNKLLLGIGAISYSLYLIHWEVCTDTVILLHKYNIAGYTAIFACITLSLFFAWLMYRLVEKPSLKLSSKIKYKRPG